MSMIPRSLRSFVPPIPLISSSLTLSVRVIVALRVWGHWLRCRISSSPCTMIHSVVSLQIFFICEAQFAFDWVVKLRSGIGLTSRTTFMSFPMVTAASLPGTFLSGHAAASDQRLAPGWRRSFLLGLNDGVSAEN